MTATLPQQPLPPAPGSPPAIEVLDLKHRFGTFQALDGLSFQVPPQSLHGFVGPNGAGKTTTLKIICTLLAPQEGTVRVFGEDVRTGVHAIRRKLGFMPDHFSMYRQMTVGEYLDFFAAAYGLPVLQRAAVVRDVLALTDMSGRRDFLIQNLSRGMQQRVSLARVLVHDPQLLLLDEPASGLDPRARIELMEILRELRRMGKTIFISSHILSELAELCDSVTIIDRGRRRYSGTMRDLLAGGEEEAVFLLELDDPPADAADRLGGLAGVAAAEHVAGEPAFRITCEPVDDPAGHLLRGVLGAGLRVRSFGRQKRHLNQAFLDLTERGVD